MITKKLKKMGKLGGALGSIYLFLKTSFFLEPAL